MSNQTFSQSMYSDSDLLRMHVHDLIVEKTTTGFKAKYVIWKREGDESDKQIIEIEETIQASNLEEAYSKFKELLSKNYIKFNYYF